MLVYFVRHGQTEDNRRGIIQGHIDTHLNDHGRKESALASRALKDEGFEEAWSSSLSRAKETAGIILTNHPEIPLQIDPGLMERYLGSLQGKVRHAGQPLPTDVEQTDKFRQRIGEWVHKFLALHLDAELALETTTESPDFTPNSGADVETDPNPNVTRTSDRKILVVSHGAYMKALLGVLIAPPFSFTLAEGVDIRESVWNTSIMRVRIRLDPGGSGGNDGQKAGVSSEIMWKGEIQSWGDVRHLEHDGEWEDVGVADDVK